jgi:hypothetical protein
MSPFLLIKALEVQLNGVLSALDVYELPASERKIVKTLKNDLVDVRLDIRDYELSETRAEQLAKARDSRRRLEKVRKGILTASEYNVFNAVDVAQFTAQLEQIMDNIQ